MAIDGVHELIKMSGATAREVQQADGTIVREYVIDDPQLLSKYRSQQSPMISSYSQQRTSYDNVPPPPPRIPLKQSTLFRQAPSINDNLPINIQQVRVLEPKRRYEYITTSGRRIEFMITNSDSDSQMINDSDVHELTNAINTRLLPSSSVSNTQPPFTLPKTWNPAVDLTHREPPTRQRVGSDHQLPPNNYNTGSQQMSFTQTDPTSYSTFNQGSYQQQFTPVFTEPIIDWSALRQQDPHGQIDQALVQQFINQRHQGGGFQTSAQFLPEQQQQQQQQPIRSTYSPPRNNEQIFYQQPVSYPYQGQQQHGVRILTTDNNNNFDFNQQQQAAMIADGHTRI